MTGDELEAAAWVAPHGDPVLDVYGDWLLASGDPRGALVAAARAARAAPDDADAVAALREVAADLLGDDLADPSLTYTFAGPFLDTVDHRPPLDLERDSDEESALHRVLDLPAAARLRSLSANAALQAESHHGAWGSHVALIERLLARPRPHLRALELDGAALPRGLHHGAQVPAMSFLVRGVMHTAEIDLGDLGALWEVAPALEHLVLGQAVPTSFGRIVAPRLRTLVVGSLDGGVVSEFAGTGLPALETLAVRASDPDAIRALLAGPALAEVRRLTLIGDPAVDVAIGDDVVSVLLAAPDALLAQLVELDLGGVLAVDEVWEALLAAAPRLRALRTLRLTTWAFPDHVEAWDFVADLQALPHAAPRERDVGARLSAALPVRWMTAQQAAFEEVLDDPHRHYGYWRDADLFAEDRGEPADRGVTSVADLVAEGLAAEG